MKARKLNGFAAWIGFHQEMPQRQKQVNRNCLKCSHAFNILLNRHNLSSQFPKRGLVRLPAPVSDLPFS